MDARDRSNGESARRTRVEDEVLEILHRADRPPTAGEQVRAWSHDARRALGQLGGGDRFAVLRGPLGALGGALLLALAGAFVRGSSPLLALLLGFASFVLFCSLWFGRGPGVAAGNRWRGRDLGPPPFRPDPFRRRGRGGWPRR